MGESTATLALIIKARDMASGQVGKFSASLKGLKSGALDGLGLGFMGAAGAAAFLTGTLAKGVKGAIEEEQGIARLSAVLKANVPAWDGTTDAIERTLKSRTDLGFADDELRASLAKLVPATHDVTKAFDVQRTAMDLARLKGISLEDASQALVKVEAGQYRALKDLGIVLRDGASQTEALAEVQKVAAGQAAAYMETTAGKAERLGNSWDELAETVGAALVPQLDRLTEALQRAGGAMDADKPATLADRLGDLSESILTLNPLTSSTGQLLGTARSRMGDLEVQTYNTAKAADTYAEKTAAAREGTNLWRKSLAPLNTQLSVTGQVASDMVAEMIAIRREGEFLWEQSHGTSYTGSTIDRSPKPKPRRKKKHHAEGGWVGMYGPEDITVGERGPEYVVPNHRAGSPQRGGLAGVTIQGVTERELGRMIDEQMFFRLRRAPS